MDKSKIRKEIAALIDSIKEHSDNIGDKKHIPQLELEMILNKIKKLYEKSIVFNYLNSIPDEKEIIKPAEPISKNVSASIVIVESIIVDSPQQQEALQEFIKPAEIIDKPIDLFGSELPPINEKSKVEKKIEKKEEKSDFSKIQKPAIPDLSKAIGINDKFQFANELFSGNMQEYSIAIHQLNTAETLESAMDYFINLQELYQWDADNDTVKRLLDLVDRRYR